MLKKSRGPVKNYIEFDDETYRASSILPGEVSLVNRYLSIHCRGTQALNNHEVLGQINMYIDLQIDPIATADAREFAARMPRVGPGSNERIDAYTRKKEERRKEIGKDVIARTRE